MTAFALSLRAEQAARRLLGWLREIPGLLALLFTAWTLWPAPVPPPLVFGEYPPDAAERTIVGGLAPIVRPYVASVPVRWEP